MISHRWEPLTRYVCLAVGFLLAWAILDAYHDREVEPAPAPVVSDEAFRARTRAINRYADALETLANQPRITPGQAEIVEDARDFIEDIDEGEITVEPPATTPPTTVVGTEGDPPATTTPPPGAAPGSISEPLEPHGTVPPTTTGP